MKKVLFSALALSVALTACNNELEEVNVQQEVTPEVVGADLVAHGMNITFAGADTRATNGGWEANDKFGLAWYNVAGAITSEQTKAAWQAATSQDKNIYTNHLFINGCDGFTTYGDIYQGAYFVVFPYNKLGAAKQMELDVNPTQTEELEDERFNKSTWISAQDFIAATEVDAEGKLTKKFVMEPAVNLISLKFTPEDGIKDNEVLKGLTIKSATIATTAAYFATKAKVNPVSVPFAQYTKGVLDEDKTKEELEGISVAFDATPATKLVTNVDIKNFNLDATRTVRMFALPAGVNAEAKASYISVVVGNEDYNLGTFTLRTTGVNKGEFEKLTQRMTVAGRNGLSFTRVMKTAAGQWAYTENALVLDVAEFTPTTSGIKTAKQWNDVIKVIDAVTELNGAAKKAYTLTLSNDIKFDATDNITAPANKDVVVTIKNNGKKITLAADAEWPANIVGESVDGNPFVAVEVAKTLTVDVDADKVLDFKVLNGGEILVNKNGKIHLADNAGRVIINQYGGKITKGNGDMGVIAFKYTADTKNYQVNNLISESAQENFAFVNTLIVEDIELDLNKAEKVSDGDEDPYTGVVPGRDVKIVAEDIAKVNFELVGNGIVKNGVIANVTAKGNGNQLVDVKASNITVEAGADLTVNTASQTTKRFDFGALVNNGTFTAGTNAAVRPSSITNKGTINGDVLKQ